MAAKVLEPTQTCSLAEGCMAMVTVVTVVTALLCCFVGRRQASISQAQSLGQKQGDTCALDWEIWEDFAEGLSAVKMVCTLD